MTLLALHAVSHSYRQGGLFDRRPKLKVLNDASLTIAPGECVALVGPSGSGKSTLSRLALGLERPDSGEITFDNTPLIPRNGTIPPATRRAIQAVFQDPYGATSPRLSAFDIIAEPLRYAGHSDIAAEVASLAASVGLDPQNLARLAHRYSGGQLQRMCIARALALRPRLVILDEAVSNLDLTTQAMVLDLLARLRHHHATAYLFITHDLRLAHGFADRTYVMESGRPIDATSPDGAPAMAHLRAALLPAWPPAEPAGRHADQPPQPPPLPRSGGGPGRGR
jgi:nickel transport system ATP-binding protein